MKLTKIGGFAAIAVAGALVLAGCAANEGGSSNATDAPATDAPETVVLEGEIAGAGASSQGSAQEAWIAAFQTANPDVTIEYDPKGSGGGRTDFISGAVSFAGTDSALSDDEIAGGFAGCVNDAFIQVPAFIDPIAVIFNIEGVDTLNLDASTIAKIFTGVVTDWSDPLIADQNDGWSASGPITVVHRSEDSGTSKNFSDYLFKTAEADWPIPDGKPADAWPFDVGTGAEGTGGVITTVGGTNGTIGYAAASRSANEGLDIAHILVGDEYVTYSPEGAAAVVAGSPAAGNATATNLAISLDRTTTDPSQYPLVLVSYLVACGEYEDPAEAAVVKAYLQYVTSEEGQEVAAGTGAAPLSSDQIAAVQAAIDTIVTE